MARYRRRGWFISARRTSLRHGLLALTLAASAASLASAVPAQAAPLPDATTGAATSVSYGSATLTGSVDPHGSETSYYFQYGLTSAFGAQTSIADAGAGDAPVKLSLPISGLQPLTVYYYRLVAVSSAGASLGHTEKLLTTKVPLSLQILSSPDPVSYGGTATVQGTLSGTENANREVILQENAFPLTAGFQNVGNPELTTAAGGFSFTVPSLSLVTQFRVTTTTSPAVLSPVAVENVAVIVTSHVTRTRRAHFARFYGTVSPAENGMQVAILRIVHGRGVLVGGTVLKPSSATSSSFSRVARVKRGVYRVLVRVTSGAQVSSYGLPLAIG
jgi:hypothetical protein